MSSSLEASISWENTKTYSILVDINCSRMLFSPSQSFSIKEFTSCLLPAALLNDSIPLTFFRFSPPTESFSKNPKTSTSIVASHSSRELLSFFHFPLWLLLFSHISPVIIITCQNLWKQKKFFKFSFDAFKRYQHSHAAFCRHSFLSCWFFSPSTQATLADNDSSALEMIIDESSFSLICDMSDYEWWKHDYSLNGPLKSSSSRWS